MAMTDWKIFTGDGTQHDKLMKLPQAPPWRFSRKSEKLEIPANLTFDAEASRAAPFRPSPEMILAVNTAVYLRRPLLIMGRPGSGKSTLISKIAHELKLGPVIRWPINSRSTVRSGVYEYDAIGRLQAGKAQEPPVENYLTLGPLGTALMAKTWPRPLLIDEIDKSDLDFANDLLNVIEEGEYEIPELRRLKKPKSKVRDYFGDMATINDGRIVSGQFPLVVMTSNAEREFPTPFLRRCVRLSIEPPDVTELDRIVQSHFERYPDVMKSQAVTELIELFNDNRQADGDVATDQLLNAVFLVIAMRESEQRTFNEDELALLKKNLLGRLTEIATWRR